MIFAKLKPERRQPSQHRILFPDTQATDTKFRFYHKPTIHESIKFNPEKLLDESEWFYIELTLDQKDNLISPYESNQISTVDLNNALESDYMVVEVVYRVFEGGEIIFTKITNKYKIRNKMWLKFRDTEEAELQKETNYVEFTGNVDAYYDGSQKIYFKKFSTVRSMFPGIEEFYREATAEEKQRFLDNNIFDVTELEPNDIGSRDSSRIAIVMNDESIGLSDGSNRDNILAAAQQFSELEIELADNKLVLRDTAALKKVLNLLTSRYYVSEITGKKMESYGSVAIERPRASIESI